MHDILERNPLIEQLTERLNLSPEQAEGAVGLLLQTLQDQLNADDFSQLKALLPDAEALLSHAPETDSGLFALAASWLGNDNIGNMARLVQGLGKLDLELDQLPDFMTVIEQFLEEQGGHHLIDRLKALLNN